MSVFTFLQKIIKEHEFKGFPDLKSNDKQLESNIIKI